MKMPVPGSDCQRTRRDDAPANLAADANAQPCAIRSRRLPRYDVLGCPVDEISLPETCVVIGRCIAGRQRCHIVTVNVDFVAKARRDPVFAEELWEADLAVADGVPLLWAARLLGTPLPGRVNGTDLVQACAQRSAAWGWRLGLMGGAEGVAEQAAAALARRYPGCRVLGIPTPCTLDERATQPLLDRIRRAKVDILFVALGAPKQERRIRAHLHSTGAWVGVGIGSALDLIGGRVPRAPVWMQRSGLEWLYRLRREPRRLARRYLVDNAPFIVWLLRERLRPARLPAP